MTSSTRTSTCSKTAARVSIADMASEIVPTVRRQWNLKPISWIEELFLCSAHSMPDLTKDERRALKQHMKGDKWSYSMGVSGRLCPSCAQGIALSHTRSLTSSLFRPTLRCTPLAGHERCFHRLRHRPLARALLDCPSREEHVPAHQPVLSL